MVTGPFHKTIHSTHWRLYRPHEFLQWGNAIQHKQGRRQGGAGSMPLNTKSSNIWLFRHWLQYGYCNLFHLILHILCSCAGTWNRATENVLNIDNKVHLFWDFNTESDNQFDYDRKLFQTVTTCKLMHRFGTRNMFMAKAQLTGGTPCCSIYN